MDKKLGLILFVLLISVALVTAIGTNIYVYEDFWGDGFCYKNNTIFPCEIINPGTTGAYMVGSSNPIIINGSLKVRDKIIGYNTTNELDNRYLKKAVGGSFIGYFEEVDGVTFWTEEFVE